ncbi:fructoselysine transporter [Escherichia coli]|uniref:Fructoselysine transporter n=1 Tax=Escherichia coli TaxID=562 RepID=A0A377DB52_ECOLX|nr:fructoselysine transporter [Escherichia coli]
MALGSFWFKAENFAAPTTTAIGATGSFMALLAGISATSWSYTGMASICYMTGEIKNPGKTMPRALIGSCLLVLVLYTLLAFGNFWPDTLRTNSPILKRRFPTP